RKDVALDVFLDAGGVAGDRHLARFLRGSRRRNETDRAQCERHRSRQFQANSHFLVTLSGENQSIVGRYFFSIAMRTVMSGSTTWLMRRLPTRLLSMYASSQLQPRTRQIAEMRSS